jgi:Na+/melibiose symporter-like transporter
LKPNTKEWIQYGSAIAMIASGVVLAFVSFFTKNDVTEGVLLYLAQALTFAGGVFGLNIYFRTKLGVAETSVREYIDQRIAERTAERTAEESEEQTTEA